MTATAEWWEGSLSSGSTRDLLGLGGKVGGSTNRSGVLTGLGSVDGMIAPVGCTWDEARVRAIY